MRLAERSVPGDLFVAVRGEKDDGSRTCSKPLARGAAAVVSDRPAPDAFPVPWVRVPEPRRVLGQIVGAAPGNPSEKLVLAGVTGTNGKTTTAMLLEGILARRYGRAGFLGTVGYRTGRAGDRRAGTTTPEAPLLQELLAEMVADGVRRPRRWRSPPTRSLSTAWRGLPLRRRGLHEPDARPPRLPRRPGRLLRREENVSSRLASRAPSRSSTRTIRADGVCSRRSLLRCSSFSHLRGAADDRAEAVVCDLSGTSLRRRLTPAGGSASPRRCSGASRSRQPPRAAAAASLALGVLRPEIAGRPRVGQRVRAARARRGRAGVPDRRRLRAHARTPSNVCCRRCAS